MLDFSVTFIITLINITILFFVLRAVLFKPVNKFMDERTNRIRNTIQQAEADRTRAQQLLAQYEQQIETAQADAEEIIKTAREQAGAEAERIIAESKVEAERILEAERNKLKAARLAAMALFRAEASALVLNAAGRLVGRELQGAEQRRFAVETLETLVRESGNADV
jgi:F-type H+-transporting ATPase subunit b